MPTTPGVPLSDETRRRVEILFHGEDAATVTRLLIEECGANLPFCQDTDPIKSERVRFAVLKLSRGQMPEFFKALRLARRDWRDVLVAAGFANHVQAHKLWMPAQQEP